MLPRGDEAEQGKLYPVGEVTLAGAQADKGLLQKHLCLADRLDRKGKKRHFLSYGLWFTLTLTVVSWQNMA